MIDGNNLKETKHMQSSKTHRLVLASLFVAIGILLPYFTSHMFGIPGTVFLPMHIPVFLTGLICGPGYGAMSGMLIPVLSSLLTGMPPVFPMLPIMVGELITYGLVSGLIHKKTGKIYISMLPAMVCGRLVYGLIFWALTLAGGEALKALSVSAAFVQGLPGIAIELVVVPLIVKAVLRGKRSAKKEAVTPVSELAEAQRRIRAGQCTCIVMQDGKIVREASGNGIKPILGFLEKEPEILSGAEVIDKVIGKAAAMLLVLAGARYVYGEMMSVSGREFLLAHGIECAYGRCIDVISNRGGNGICPLEKSVMDISDPVTGYEVLKSTVATLMKAM